MTLLRRQLTLTLTGRLDTDQLDAVRANLTLTATGTPTDPVGTELGRYARAHARYRTITEAVFTLTRSDVSEWSLTVDAIEGDAIPKWRSFAEIGCRAAGLHIAGRTLPPPPEPIPPREWLTILQRARTTMADTDRRLEAARRPHSETDTPRPASPSSAYIDRLGNITPAPTWGPVPPRHSVTIAELCELARDLRRFVWWSWRSFDTLTLSRFGWTATHFTPDLITLDTRTGVADGHLHCHEDDVTSIEIPLAVPPRDNTAPQLPALFDEMVTALTTELDPPDTRTQDPHPLRAWALGDYALVLTLESAVITLYFERLPTWWLTPLEDPIDLR